MEKGPKEGTKSQYRAIRLRKGEALRSDPSARSAQQGKSCRRPAKRILLQSKRRYLQGTIRQEGSERWLGNRAACRDGIVWEEQQKQEHKQEQEYERKHKHKYRLRRDDFVR